MAIFRSITAERQEEVLDQTIVSASLEDGDLLLRRHNDTTINLGPISNPPLSESLITLESFETPPMNYVVPEWNAGDHRNRILDAISDEPEGVGRGVAWSPDGIWLVVTHDVTPFMSIYRRNGDELDEYIIIGGSPIPARAEHVVWSPDGQYFAVAHLGAPYIRIYKNIGGVWTPLDPPDVNPAGTAYGVDWSPDGNYLAVAHNNAPCVTIYEFENEELTKLPDPADLPTSSGESVEWHPNGRYLVVGGSGATNFVWYEQDGTTFTKLTDPADLPEEPIYRVAWSPNGKHLAMATGFFGGLAIYKLENSDLIRIPNTDIDDLPVVDEGYGVSWSPDGNYLSFVGNGTIPFTHLTVYRRSGDTFKNTDSLNAAPPGISYHAAWSPDGALLAVAHGTTPFLTIYKSAMGFVEGIPIRPQIVP